MPRLDVCHIEFMCGSRSGSIRTVLVLMACSTLMAACRDEGSATNGGNGGNGTHSTGVGSTLPTGEDECAAAVSLKYGLECADPNVQCGAAAYCTSPLDCIAGPDRCTPKDCSGDADCQDQYGSLCTGVEWRCEGYISSSACFPRTPG